MKRNTPMKDKTKYRELNKPDEYYIEYVETNNVTYLKLLNDDVNPWLFEMAYNFVLDEDLAEEITKDVWTEFLRHKSRWNPYEKAVELEFYYLMKNHKKYWN